MTATTITPAEAGRRGRARSMKGVTPEQVAAGLAAIASVRPGTEFSVNLVRHQLDAVHFPHRARAGLFARACADRLIEPVYYPGTRDPRREPSTGFTAHHALVKLYRRTPTG
ncbi:MULTISPECIES: hypothetical protein [unclassified Isoptericola]|uniref:hypothetical protein n=1 Tax=unclassified Isoptericola TaxID=2623355 RepID=UPI00364BB809